MVYSQTMASSFARLFRYAKAIGADAKENFTTEALAAAVRTDARPLLEAIGELLAQTLPTSATTTIETQFAVRAVGVGVVDAVLTVVDGDRRRVAWIEVKVDAAESGDQIVNYQRYIDAMPTEHRPVLLVLGPKKLREGVPWVSWQRLREAIKRTGTTSPYWLDFSTYLEEIRMADSYDETVTKSEAEALQPARRLLGKLARMLTPFASQAATIWEAGPWPIGDQKVTDALLLMFEKKGTLTIASAVSQNEGVSAGLYHEPATEDGWLGLWIWMNPRRVRERRAILDAAAKVEWSDEWQRDEGDWAVVGAYRRLVEIGSHAEGTAWLVSKYVELRDAGLLGLLAKG